MAYYARVKPEAPGNLKYEELGERLGINPMQAFGMAVAIWCLCWEFEFIDGKLKRFTAKSLARKVKWEGDADKLLGALLDSRVLEREADGTLVAHDWVEEQYGGVQIMQRNRSRNKPPVTAPPPPAPTAPAQGSDEIIRQVLQQMKLSHIPGAPAQKREHVEAWKARGISGGDILAVVMNNPGKGVFELEKLLTKGSAAKPPSTLDAIKNWAKEGDARDAAAAEKNKGMVKK